MIRLTSRYSMGDNVGIDNFRRYGELLLSVVDLWVREEGARPFPVRPEMIRIKLGRRGTSSS